VICSDDRGTHLRELVKKIPLNRLVLGSDAPYLTPFNIPKPYPKHNEPMFLPHTLSKLAECLNTSLLEVAMQTTKNTRELFNLPSIEYDGTTKFKR